MSRGDAQRTTEKAVDWATAEPAATVDGHVGNFTLRQLPCRTPQADGDRFAQGVLKIDSVRFRGGRQAAITTFQSGEGNITFQAAFSPSIAPQGGSAAGDIHFLAANQRHFPWFSPEFRFFYSKRSLT